MLAKVDGSVFRSISPGQASELHMEDQEILRQCRFRHIVREFHWWPSEAAIHLK